MSEARTSTQAIQRYKKPLQRVLGCLTKTIWIVAPSPGDELLRLTIAGGPVPIFPFEGSIRRLYLDASQKFEVRHDGEQFRVSTQGYIYTLSESEMLETELISWHWHPPSRSRPHLHFADRKALGHVPTGRVTFESIARYLIEDLGARSFRKDWHDILLTSEAQHIKYRTWSVDPDVDPA